MKGWKKAVCLVLALVLIGLAGLIFWQRDNVGAMILYLKTDPEVIQDQKEQLDQQHREDLETETGETISVSLPTAQQCDALLNGTASPDQIKQELGLPLDGAQPAYPLDSFSGIVNACAAELAAFKVDIMANLGTIKADILAQWTALPAEARTPQKKAALLMDGLKQCYDYEAQADEAVKACLEYYREALTAIGEDTGVMDLFWTQYCEEKQTEKAFYLDRYLN